jgi:cytochrome c oxidase assembly protein subunit 15
VALGVGVGAWRSNYLGPEPRWLGLGVTVLVLAQAGLGVATLVARVPVSLGVAHQLTAALTLCLAVAFAWRVSRV